ncbi:MAG: helicase-related protein [Candidatus Hodarchaeota archaeon]
MPMSPNPEIREATPIQFDSRQYQEHILKRIQENQDHNILVELDCGLGKRVLTYKLVAETFPNTRFVITVNSSSSLQETAQYLEKEYGGVKGLGVLSPHVRGPRRLQMLKESRVILCTARVLANILRKGVVVPETFEGLMINEVDTILRRVGHNQVLIQPWSFLLDFFKNHWIIGLSGTLRDDHVVFDNAQIHLREELQTLAGFLKNVELITMDELKGTDLKDYIKPTVLDVVPVQDPVIRATAMVLDDLIQSTREEIYQVLQDEGQEPGSAIPQTTRLLHLMLHELPIPEDLAVRYSGLLMIRKYLYGMSASSFRRYLYHPILTPKIDTQRILQDWPKITPKVQEVVNLTKKANKTVILSSYLHVVSEINELLTQQGVQTFKLTGRVKDKQSVLVEFKHAKAPAAIILSPVGERDLDLPSADLLIICDTINTTKTIYQKMKRSRGGRVVFLFYANTSEVGKLRRLIDNIMKRYPWSTQLRNVSDLHA